MLYSGVNIFGQLSELYLQSKDEFQAVAIQQTGKGGPGTAAAGSGGPNEDSGSSGMMSLNANVLQIFKRL